jgi:HlyD family secretion protein
MSGMDRPIEKKGLFQKKYVIIGIAILLFIALLVKVVFGDNRSRLNVETDKISIEQVEEGVFQDYIAVIGTVEPIKTIYLDAIEGGRVDEIVQMKARWSNQVMLF